MIILIILFLYFHFFVISLNSDPALILRESIGSRGKLDYYSTGKLGGFYEKATHKFPKTQFCNLMKISRSSAGCHKNKFVVKKMCVKCEAPAMKNGTCRGE